MVRVGVGWMMEDSGGDCVVVMDDGMRHMEVDEAPRMPDPEADA